MFFVLFGKAYSQYSKGMVILPARDSSGTIEISFRCSNISLVINGQILLDNEPHSFATDEKGNLEIHNVQTGVHTFIVKTSDYCVYKLYDLKVWNNNSTELLIYLNEKINEQDTCTQIRSFIHDIVTKPTPGRIPRRFISRGDTMLWLDQTVYGSTKQYKYTLTNTKLDIFSRTIKKNGQAKTYRVYSKELDKETVGKLKALLIEDFALKKKYVAGALDGIHWELLIIVDDNWKEISVENTRVGKVVELFDAINGQISKKKLKITIL